MKRVPQVGLIAFALILGAGLLPSPARAATNSIASTTDTDSQFVPPMTFKWRCEIDGTVFTSASGSSVSGVDYNIGGSWDGSATIIGNQGGCCGAFFFDYSGQSASRYALGTGPYAVWSRAYVLPSGGTTINVDSGTVQWTP